MKAVHHILVSNVKINALSMCVSSGQPAPPYRDVVEVAEIGEVLPVRAGEPLATSLENSSV
jgi:hypothetical protein